MTVTEPAPLRVLFLTPYYKPYLGGIERVIERLTTGLLARRDVAATGVLTTHFAFPRKHMEGLPPFERMDGGVRVYRVPGRPRVAPPYFSVPLVWFPPRALRQVIAGFQPDILHWVGDGWFWGHYWSARAAPRTTGIVFSPSFHRLTPDKQWLRPLNIALCRRADRVTALSRLEAAAIRPAYLVAPHKQMLLPWGVDAPPEGVEPVRDGDARFTVLCVGRLGAHKNQRFLLGVWAAARGRFIRPARLVLVGRDEGDSGGEAVVRRLIAAHDLEGEVQLTGEVTDAGLHAWYARADVFALFSRYEAFGLVFFEAMAAGVPILTHRVGANAELLRHGAVLTDPGDERAAVEGLVALVNDDALRCRLGAEAKTYATAFTWGPVIERFVALYREVLEERSPPPPALRTEIGQGHSVFAPRRLHGDDRTTGAGRHGAVRG
jgi:glycosyltransferase involved in cell wall biosynthesis